MDTLLMLAAGAFLGVGMEVYLFPAVRRRVFRRAAAPRLTYQAHLSAVAIDLAVAAVMLGFTDADGTGFWLGIAAVDLYRLWKHDDDNDQHRRKAVERLSARLREFAPSPVPSPAAG